MSAHTDTDGHPEDYPPAPPFNEQTFVNQPVTVPLVCRNRHTEPRHISLILADWLADTRARS